MATTTWTFTSNRFTSNARLGLKGVTIDGSTATRTVSDEDMIVADASTQSQTITLLTAVGRSGKVYEVRRTNTGANTVTVTSSVNIDGVSSVILNDYHRTLRVISNGSVWISEPDYNSVANFLASVLVFSGDAVTYRGTMVWKG